MDSEFCEIDFTTATPWENLNAKIEEIFYSWKLYQSSDENTIPAAADECLSFEFGKWNVSHKNIDYDGKDFRISYYHKSPIKDNMSSDCVTSNLGTTNSSIPAYLLPMDIHCLSRNSSKLSNDNAKVAKLIRLYNLNDFVLLTCANQGYLSNEANVKLFLSTFCITAFNTRCFLPMFVQVFQSWQNCFVGIRVDEEGIRLDYQTIHLGKIPSNFNYFSGILDFFKSKTSPSHSNIVSASVKLSYSLSNFTNFAWPRFKRPLNTDESIDEPVQVSSFELPFGAGSEPIGEIQLHVSWPQVYENMVLDNEHHSDFDPQNSQNWVLQVRTKEVHHLMGQYLSESIQQCLSNLLINDLISDLLKRKNFNDLNVPVPSTISISRIISGGPDSNGNEIRRSKRFLPEESLVAMLYYLFPDADSTNAFPYYLNKVNSENKDNALLKGMKTCEVDELPWRLSIIMCIILNTYGSHAAAQFWFEFIQELRFRWEKNLRIPGVQKGSPNHKTSILNQKLQMLNCCIVKKMKREGVVLTSDDEDLQELPSKSHREKIDSDDEEFFDCQSECKVQKADNFKTARVSAWDQPEGRLRKFNDLRLIETGEFMYIPITQEMTPKTEDQLEEDAMLLMKLGSDAQGSQLRARMMCASLYSDMESFKAANPGSVLDDFIRWYSPRDWIENADELDKFGQKKGKLSNRMMLPGNMWKEVWDTSFPVPACRQKCLFDDIKESEKVLHFFESSKTVGDVFGIILPTLLHTALHTILEENDTISMLRAHSPSVDEKLSCLVQKSVAVTRNASLDTAQYKHVIGEICEVETVVSLYKSIEFKLFPGDILNEEEEKSLLLKLVNGSKQIIVPNASKSRLGKRITFLFSKENADQSSEFHSTVNKKDVGSSSIVSATNDFFQSATASFNNSPVHQHVKHTFNCAPYQKEFVLHVDTSLPAASSRSISHSLTAHICSQEIFIASCIGRDLIFV